MNTFLKKKTVAEASEEMLRLKAYLKPFPVGSKIPYQKMENETGVKMDVDSKGRQYMRSALRSLRIAWTCIVGEGIELMSGQNSVRLQHRESAGINNRIKRASKVTEIAMEQHLEDMTPADREMTEMTASLYARHTVLAKIGERQYKKVIKTIN